MSKLESTAYANSEARRIFWAVLAKHWKRGNWHHRPDLLIAGRAAAAARWICLGCPPERTPRYLGKVQNG